LLLSCAEPAVASVGVSLYKALQVLGDWVSGFRFQVFGLVFGFCVVAHAQFAVRLTFPDAGMVFIMAQVCAHVR